MTTTHTPITREQLADLVHRLSPSRADATRDEWVKVGMAIHAADSSEYGFSLFDGFSRQSPKYDAANLRATWRSLKPGPVTVATLIALANADNPLSAPTTKRAYQSLAEYASAHYAPLDAFTAAGWRETRHDGRPALAFRTDSGVRYRFTDGQKPTYDSPYGFKRCWYQLDEAVRIARASGGPLVLCNGEASTVAAQAHGIAACAVAGGTEKPTLPDNLLAELRAAWGGEILVALDCDQEGRSAAPQLAAQLTTAGMQARAVNLGGSMGFDLADYCGLNNGTSAALVRTLPDLIPPPVAPTSADERPARFTIRNLEDLAQVQPPTWLLQNEIIAHAFNLIYGASGSGKTFYAIDRALRVAASGRRVCYVATEDLAGLKIRVAAWRAAHAAADVRGFTWLGMPEGLDLSDLRQVDDLVATLAPLGFDLITLDTLREAHTGDENSSQDMAAVNRAIQRLIRETGAALDVVHHSGVNDGRERGSTALAANCDLKLKVSNDDGVVVVSCEKLRNGQPFTPRYYQISQVTITDSHTPVGVLRESSQTTTRNAPLTQAQRKILDTLALSIFATTGAKTSQIGDATGIPAGSLYRALSALKNREYIAQSTKGDPYTITPTGRAALAPDLIVAEPSDYDDYHDDGAQQEAQLSPTITNYHDSHDSTTLLSLTITTPRGDSDDSGEREKRESDRDPARIPWASVADYLRQGNPDRILQLARGMWRLDPVWVLEQALARYPEHAALIAAALQPDGNDIPIVSLADIPAADITDTMPLEWNPPPSDYAVAHNPSAAAYPWVVVVRSTGRRLADERTQADAIETARMYRGPDTRK